MRRRPVTVLGRRQVERILRGRRRRAAEPPLSFQDGRKSDSIPDLVARGEQSGLSFAVRSDSGDGRRGRMPVRIRFVEFVLRERGRPSEAGVDEGGGGVRPKGRTFGQHPR